MPAIHGEQMDPYKATNLVEWLIVPSTHSSIMETLAMDISPTQGELGSGAYFPLKHISMACGDFPMCVSSIKESSVPLQRVVTFAHML